VSGANVIGSGALLGARVRIPQAVVYRSFANETVVLNLDTGIYHGMNPTGGNMLDVLDKVGSLREAAGALAHDYELPLSEIQEDLCAFCEGLIERGLLVVESD
jgi:hypothetical protein